MRTKRGKERRPDPPVPPPAEHPASERRSRLEYLAPILIAIAGIASYRNSLHGPFVLDDVFAISNNQTIRSLSPLGRVLSPPERSPVAGRPLVNLSLALNYAISEYDVTSYHVFNVIFHVLSGLLVFALCKRMLRSPDLVSRYGGSAPGIAAATALLWTVHPLATETVDYTTQRTELLMSFFFLLTVYCAVRGFESVRRAAWYAASLGAFGLGLASKEVIVVAPAVIFVADWLFWSGSPRAALRRHRLLYGGYVAVVVVFLAILGTRLRRTFSGLTARMSPWDYALTQTGVIVHYLRLALWPHPLSADYQDWPVADSVMSVLPWFLLVTMLLLATVWGLATRRKLAFLGAWFFLILAPTSSFRPLSVELAAERRMYLPLAAVIVLLVLGGYALSKRIRLPRAVGYAVIAILVVVLGLSTMRRHAAYASTLAFWTDVVEKRPDNVRARIWLGKHYQETGQRAEALRHFEEAVRLDPTNADAQYDVAVVLAGEGRTNDAVEHYREALRLNPNDASAHNNLGALLQNRGEIDQAVQEYREAVRINPNHFNARYNLAVALAAQGSMTEAIRQIDAAIQLRPDSAAARRIREQFRLSGALP